MKKYLRVSAPINSIEDVEILKKAGADELYCGFIPKEFEKKWPSSFVTLNHRGKGQSFENFQKLKEATNLAYNNGLPLYVAINEFYSQEQYPVIIRMVKKIECLPGIRGIIIADLGLLFTLREMRFEKEIHISTMSPCFNSKSVDFFNDLGANRVILPKHITCEEIKSLVKERKSKIDIEIFIINGGACQFVEGYCSFFHFLKPGNYRGFNEIWQFTAGCSFFFEKKLAKKEFAIFNAKNKKEKKCNLEFHSTSSFGCALCDLFELENYLIKSLKIVGRGLDPTYLANLVRIVLKALKYLEAAQISKKEYAKKCKNLVSNKILNKQFCNKFDCLFSKYWTNEH